MGNSHSTQSRKVSERMNSPNGEREILTKSVNHVSIKTKQIEKLPIPDADELERRFQAALASMDLPPDKAKLLKQYDDEKKWDIICDQDRVHAKDPPSHYLNKLRTYLDPKASRSSRALDGFLELLFVPLKRKMVGESTSTQVLRDLEISLRTNHIEWVKAFLDEDNRGLDVLIDYLSFRLGMMRHEQRITESCQNSDEAISNGHIRPPLTDMETPRMKRASKHVAKLNMGESKDDTHVCIMCLRAIMNNKFGFNMVFQHTEAINCIALSLNHKSLRTKALVLELLAAICLFKGGHQIILRAFDNFKEVCIEEKRFETLMNYFEHYEVFHIEFMVACMQFMNIVVHSVDDMNYRVHLQYEFTQLGLDDYLEKLRHTESEELQIQISAYLDNVFDVAALMEDSETKTAALEKVAELEDDLGHANDRIQEIENECMAKLVEMESELSDMRRERDELAEKHRQIDEEVSTLRRAVTQKEEESKHRQSMLESKIQELETLTKTLPRGASAECTDGAHESSPTPPIPPAPPSAAVSPPPPPPPCPPHSPLGKPPPMAPPPPGMLQVPGDAMTIKRKMQTKYRLPTLNWIALKPNQVRGTIFNELDDDKLMRVIDFIEFEEQFKISNLGAISGDSPELEGFHNFPSKRFKKPETISLLEHNRLRNIAISRRKLDMNIDAVIRAVNSLDLKALTLENVEIVQRMVPTEAETKAYREYTLQKQNIDKLTDEDKFLLQFCRVERLAAKLNVMSYMGNFHDHIHLVTPQVHAIITASRSVKSSVKLKKLLEIILAFGNYMNSSKRGPAYGFKLQSLDSLLDTKSTDKRMCLLHYIADTVRQKFPDLSNFDAELRYVEKAAAVTLENILSDVNELEKGMDLTRKEFELRKDFKDKQNMVLKDFFTNSEDKLRKLKGDAKIAQENFQECVEYFGETHRQIDANAFFAMIMRFVRAYKVAEQENEKRRRLELVASEAGSPPNDVVKRNKINQKKQQRTGAISKKSKASTKEAVINELKNKTRNIQEMKLLQQDEVYNGALEDILLGLKNEPYRRADAVRRSQRRRVENNRLSRTMEELEL